MVFVCFGVKFDSTTTDWDVDETVLYAGKCRFIYKRMCVFCRREFFMKPNAIAPIVVEILLCRGSARKIVAHSGIKLLEKI